jgi:FkbM family methyltransferase
MTDVKDSRGSAGTAMQILFKERRIPGSVYKYAFRSLDSVGIQKVTIKNRGLKVTGFTPSLWEYFVIWDKKTYDVPGCILSPGKTVIDIGANQGFFTLYAASRGARVFAFEPSKANFAVLRQNVEQNNLSDRVFCFDCAVSGSSGTATLYEGLTRSGRFLSTTASIRDTNRGGTNVRAAVTTTLPLDEIFEKNKIETCDLLKIDCEGSEYQILPAVSKQTFAKIKNIAMEFHEGRPDELRSWLEAGGFEIVSHDKGLFGILKARNRAFASN